MTNTTTSAYLSRKQEFASHFSSAEDQRAWLDEVAAEQEATLRKMMDDDLDTEPETDPAFCRSCGGPTAVHGRLCGACTGDE